MNTRWIFGIGSVVALITLLSFTPLTTYAQGPGKGTQPGQGAGRGQGLCVGANFVDANGDGVCDYAGTGVGRGQATANGQRMGRGQGMMANFVDNDGNGVCDNFANRTPQGRGMCANNFVDNDGDGICDYAQNRGQPKTQTP